MKPGGNRPAGDNPLLFSISGTGSFICPVAQARLDIPGPLITQPRSTGGKAKMSEWPLGLTIFLKNLRQLKVKTNLLTNLLTYHLRMALINSAMAATQMALTPTEGRQMNARGK